MAIAPKPNKIVIKSEGRGRVRSRRAFPPEILIFNRARYTYRTFVTRWRREDGYCVATGRIEYLNRLARARAANKHAERNIAGTGLM